MKLNVVSERDILTCGHVLLLNRPNYSAVSRRLTATIKKLKDHPEILKQYGHVLREQLQSGVVELVPQYQIPQPGSVHCLPHRAVVRFDRNITKVRVAYDASSKLFGPSLNDCLHIEEPKLTSSCWPTDRLATSPQE